MSSVPSSVPAVPRSIRAAPPGRRQVRLAADDLAEIVELALRRSEPSTVAVLERIAGHDGQGAREVIARALDSRRPAPQTAPRRRISIGNGVGVDGGVAGGRRPLGRALAEEAADIARGEGTVSVVGAAGIGKSTLIDWVAHRRGRPLATIDLAAGDALELLVDGIRRDIVPGMTVALLDAHAREASAVAALVAAVPQNCLTLVETRIPDATPLTGRVLTLGYPELDAIDELLRAEIPGLNPLEARILAALSLGETPRTLVQGIERARRFAGTTTVPEARALRAVTQQRFAALPPRRRQAAAEALLREGRLSQRAVSELTGVSRDTLRRVRV